MRLSEAVLLGLPEIRFSNDTWFRLGDDGVCEGCLVGSALRAVGSEAYLMGLRELPKIWPWTGNRKGESDCPACHITITFRSFGFADMLTHLAWHYLEKEITAEQIADYIRTIEPEESPEQQPATEAAGLPVVEQASK